MDISLFIVGLTLIVVLGILVYNSKTGMTTFVLIGMYCGAWVSGEISYLQAKYCEKEPQDTCEVRFKTLKHVRQIYLK